MSYVEFISKDNVTQEPSGLIDQLSKFLLNYVNKLNVPLYLDNEKFNIEECFTNNAFLPLFLFKVEDSIETFIEQFNLNKLVSHSLFRTYQVSEEVDTKVIDRSIKVLYLETEDTYMGATVHIEHNLSEVDSYSLIVHLAQYVLSNKNLVMNNNVISIDTLYDEVSKNLEKEFSYSKFLNGLPIDEEGETHISDNNGRIKAIPYPNRFSEKPKIRGNNLCVEDITKNNE